MLYIMISNYDILRLVTPFKYIYILTGDYNILYDYFDISFVYNNILKLIFKSG